jgi:hypothetical protein
MPPSTFIPQNNATTYPLTLDPAVDPSAASAIMSTAPCPLSLRERTKGFTQMRKLTAKELIEPQLGGSPIFRCPLTTCQARFRDSASPSVIPETPIRAEPVRCLLGCPAVFETRTQQLRHFTTFMCPNGVNGGKMLICGHLGCTQTFPDSAPSTRYTH